MHRNSIFSLWFPYFYYFYLFKDLSVSYFLLLIQCGIKYSLLFEQSTNNTKIYKCNKLNTKLSYNIKYSIGISCSHTAW